MVLMLLFLQELYSICISFGTSNGDTVDVVGFGTFNVANISIKDLTKLHLQQQSLGTAGQMLLWMLFSKCIKYANASSAEVYGFKKTFTGSTINRYCISTISRWF